MTKGSKAILAMALAIGLGGCQSFSGGSSLAALNDVDPATIDMSGYFADRLEAGRNHLRSNRPTLAITAFRQASYDPTYAADAYNGMGVAYAQIGRADVARRYFGMAVAAAPQDERYVRNLARLEGTSEIQLASQEAAPVAPVARAETTAPVLAEKPSAPMPLVRVSSNEVHVVTTAPSARPAVRVTTGRTAGQTALRASGQPQYPVRIALSDANRVQASYPVRIELPKAK